MIVKPFGDQILIKPQKLGHVLGDASLCKYGEVIAIGDDVKIIKAGQVIGFVEWGMNKLIIDNEEHYFVREESRWILGTI